MEIVSQHGVDLALENTEKDGGHGEAKLDLVEMYLLKDDAEFHGLCLGGRVIIFVFFSARVEPSSGGGTGSLHKIEHEP